MKTIALMLALTILGVCQPDNYPPEPAKGANGPNQPKGGF